MPTLSVICMDDPLVVWIYVPNALLRSPVSGSCQTSETDMVYTMYTMCILYTLYTLYALYTMSMSADAT